MDGFCDIHCHVLPGLDDGPGDIESALELALKLEELGFTSVYPTPHHQDRRWSPTNEQADEAVNLLRQALREKNSSLIINQAAGENMLDGQFIKRQSDNSYPTYPDGKSFLLEFGHELLPPNIEKQLFNMRVSGRLPVIAHIERYPELARNIPRIMQLSSSCAVLINLSSIGGMAGFWTKRLARKLLKMRAVHAVSTDSHSAMDIEFCKKGLKWMREKLDESTINRYLIVHPKQIVTGVLPEW